MQCPGLTKGNKGNVICGGELQTLRTLANGKKVRRERVCKKCHSRLWTVELLETDLQTMEAAYATKINSIEDENITLRDNVKRIKYTFHSFMEAIGYDAAI